MNLTMENDHRKQYENTAALSGQLGESYMKLFLSQRKMNIEYPFMRTRISSEKLPGENSSFILPFPGEQKVRSLVRHSPHDYLWAMT